jgi:hypothetical protein
LLRAAEAALWWKSKSVSEHREVARMRMFRTVLSQLVDSEDLKALDADELRDMLAKLDDQVVYGTDEVVSL